MIKSITLFIGLFLMCTTCIYAQDALKIDDITVVNSKKNNVSIQIDLAAQGQIIYKQITQTNVSAKAGFTPTLNADKTLLTLNFTQQFNENELYTLLEYSGIKLNATNFKQLHQIINQ